MIASYVSEIMVANFEMPLFLMDPPPMQIAKLQDVWRIAYDPKTGELR